MRGQKRQSRAQRLLFQQHIGIQNQVQIRSAALQCQVVTRAIADVAMPAQQLEWS